MNFFDLTGLYIPRILYDYQDVEIIEKEETVIFKNNNTSIKIYRSRPHIYVQYPDLYDYYHYILMGKADPKVTFDHIVNAANSFKMVREKDNIEILDACIGLMLSHKIEKIFFSARHYNTKSQSNLFEYQKAHLNVNFRKMNKVLSSIYSFDQHNRYLTKQFDVDINFDLVTNHKKMEFIEKFEKYSKDYGVFL